MADEPHVIDVTARDRVCIAGTWLEPGTVYARVQFRNKAHADFFRGHLNWSAFQHVQVEPKIEPAVPVKSLANGAEAKAKAKAAADRAKAKAAAHAAAEDLIASRQKEADAKSVDDAFAVELAAEASRRIAESNALAAAADREAAAVAGTAPTPKADE